LVNTMQVVVDGERSPPPYYALVWLWSRAWGTGAVAMRSLSAIFGVITVLAAYLAGHELTSRRAGVKPLRTEPLDIQGFGFLVTVVRRQGLRRELALGPWPPRRAWRRRRGPGSNSAHRARPR